MTPEQRHQNNLNKLQELFKPFQPKVKLILGEMQSLGWQAIIAQAWRSRAEELADFKAGNSKVRFGFHNVTINGKKSSMAADITDARFMWNIPQEHPYWAALGKIAHKYGCFWGGDWHWKDVAHVQYFDNDELAEVEEGHIPMT